MEKSARDRGEARRPEQQRAEVFGAKARELRERASLSQGELAEATGLSRATVIAVEKAQVVPHPKTRRKISAALGADVRELWR